jgi:hypothetical protein
MSSVRRVPYALEVCIYEFVCKVIYCSTFVYSYDTMCRSLPSFKQNLVYETILVEM